MPFQRTKPRLILMDDVAERLRTLGSSRIEPIHRVERARMLLAYAEGGSVAAIARRFHTNRMKVDRCVNRALQLGAEASMEDLPGRGKPPKITTEARAWVLSLACEKPKQFGYSYELWTTRLLSSHIRKHCEKVGHPSLSRISRGTVSKILTKSQVRPHKISYYLERRDPEFEEKMAQVLCVYREVELLRKAGDDPASLIAVLSYDEKPGIQAIANTAPDLPPVPGKHPCISRDHEYVRHGTVALMAGIDLLSGKVHGIVVDRQRSREFVSFLRGLDANYPPTARLRLVLDNHSAHISKETRAYLATVPNRFEFIFTPKHGSWLNLIESFFGKMARTMLWGIRVSSKTELKERIMQYLDEVNASPVTYHWKYKMEPVSLL
ncbi:MAG: IS630 family transposase [Acidobacteriota bacterium]